MNRRDFLKIIPLGTLLSFFEWKTKSEFELESITNDDGFFTLSLKDKNGNYKEVSRTAYTLENNSQRMVLDNGMQLNSGDKLDINWSVTFLGD